MERRNLVVPLDSSLQRLDGFLEPLQPNVQSAEVVERPDIRAIERDRALIGHDGGIRFAHRLKGSTLQPHRLARRRIEPNRGIDVHQCALWLRALEQDAAEIQMTLHVG